MTRPQLGTHPVLTELDSESYLDFVEGIFTYIRNLTPTAHARANVAFKEFEAENGRPVKDVYEASDVLHNVGIIASRNRFRHAVQNMNHDAVIGDLGKRETELLAELDRYDKMGPGSVSYDPNFDIPEYATREIHRLPGGYVKNPLAGYWYHACTRTFFMGKNDRDEVHQSGVDKLPLPADGQVRRILDIGCTAGQSATALKKRFPQAEVWGLDIGAPVVRYAHRRAVDMGLDVHFVQGLAEKTNFPDASFDIVHSFIVFHELPLDIGEQVAQEARRLLRPGGLFLVTDFGTKHVTRADTGDTGSFGEVMGMVDHKDNEEPYAWDFTHSDFEGMLSKYFSNVEVRREGYGMPLRVATR